METLSKKKEMLGPAFIVFFYTERENYSNRFPKLDFFQLKLTMKRKWLTLTDEEKAPYINRIHELNPDGSMGLMEEDDPSCQEYPKEAFVFFFHDQRKDFSERFPNIDFFQLKARVRRKWLSLKAEERAPYEAQADADKKRFDDAVRDYEAEQTAHSAKHLSALVTELKCE